MVWYDPGVTQATQQATQLNEFAGQAVAYVQRALGVELGYDSETLPVLDHYLSTVPRDRPEMIELVSITAGAYFGEVVIRQLRGRWEMDVPTQPLTWRVVMPTGLSFSPMGMVAAAIAQDDVVDVDAEFDAPTAMRPYVEAALAGMSEQSTEEYYSLCGRYDTAAHLHEVLVAVAARLLETAGDPASDESDEPAADPADVAADVPKPPGDSWN